MKAASVSGVVLDRRVVSMDDRFKRALTEWLLEPQKD